jgi:PAS domain S-box-containing protein
MEHQKITPELKEQLENWDRTFNAIADLIFIQDKDNTIIKVNQAFADVFKARPEDLEGQKCYQLLHKLSKPWPDCPMEKTKQDKKAHTEEVNDPNIGVPLLVTTSPIFDDKGELIGSVHIAKIITEQKKAEQEMRRLAAIVESSDDAIIGKTLEGIIFSWNKGAEKIYGYSAEEVLGKNISLLALPERCEEIPKLLEKVKHGQAIEHFETIRKRKDGRQLIVSLTISPIKDRAGNIIGASTISRDITQLKQIEEQLRKSEEKYRELVEHANSIILRMGKDGKIIFFNEFAQSFFGYKEEEVIGKNVIGTIVPKTDKAGQDLSAMIRDIGTFPERYINNENENMLRSGKRVWVAWTNKAIFNQAGQIEEILCVGNDITEHKRIEDALKDREIKYRTLFDSSSDAIMILAPEERFVSGNNATLKLFGCQSEAEFTKYGPADLSPENQPDGMPSAVKAAEMIKIALENGMHSFEWVHKRLDNTEFIASVLLTRMELEGKKYVQATVRDISEQKRMQEELKKKIESLERFQRVTVDRELRMKELKQEIAQLKAKLEAKT